MSIHVYPASIQSLYNDVLAFLSIPSTEDQKMNDLHTLEVFLDELKEEMDEVGMTEATTSGLYRNVYEMICARQVILSN